MVAGPLLLYEPMVHRFGQDFVIVASVMQRTGGGAIGHWNEEHGFYFDVIRHDTERVPLETSRTSLPRA